MKRSALQQESAEPLLFNFLAFLILFFLGKDLHTLWHDHFVPYRLAVGCLLSAPPARAYFFSPAQSCLAGGFGPSGQQLFQFCSSHSSLERVDRLLFVIQSFHSNPVHCWQW